jgi:flagellar biosynthetic protein FlhB
LFFALDQLTAVLALIVIPMVFIAIMDAGLAWWRHYSELKMTPDEVRREQKEIDGNPEIKARIRQQQREMARKRMMQAIPGADVVVTNPTHYAVALKYEEGKMRAPRVVAKGVDLTAARIRGIAAEHRVQLIEAPKLARALYAHAELDSEIPMTLYTAVAQVLAFVYQLRAGLNPQDLGEIEIPQGLDPHEKATI